MNIQSILVPVDFSPHADQALNHAVFWAETIGARLTVLHVNTLFGERHNYNELVKKYDEVIKKEEEEARQWMEAHQRNIAQKRLDVHYDIIRAARPATAIMDYATKHKIDLMFMGTHGWSGSPGLLIGDVLDKILRLSDIPVITVHKDHPIKDIKKILAPIDFSKYSEKVVKDAEVLANLFDAEVHLMYVIEKENAQSFQWLDDVRLLLKDVDDEIVERVQNELERFKTPGLTHRVVDVVRVGRPYEQIDLYAREQAIDLIIMAIRGYSRFEYFWSFGSNTERVVKMAPCPVLVTGRKKHDAISENKGG